MAVKYAGPDDFNVAAAEDGVFYRQYARRDVVKPMPTEEQIKDILRSMGKNSPDDELNCGTCGYDSCRDKAVAVFRGIADPSMCLPFIMDRSERFSNNIFDNSPNGLIVVNDDFEIQQLNKQAMELLNIRSQSDVLGENVVRILDPTPFFQVFETGKKLTNQRKYYSDYKKYFEQTIVRDKASHMLICILRDVTEEEVARRKQGGAGPQDRRDSRQGGGQADAHRAGDSVPAGRDHRRDQDSPDKSQGGHRYPMKRNEFFADIGYMSLNHYGEELCGDHVEVVQQGEPQDHNSKIIVLADGLGSGVKASILAILTSKIISTMLAANLKLEDAVETIAATLPVSPEVNTAFSTFTIMRIVDNQRAQIIQYENPDIILLRDGKNYEHSLQRPCR
jgi:PAS domain-containing protein